VPAPPILSRPSCKPLRGIPRLQPWGGCQIILLAPSRLVHAIPGRAPGGERRGYQVPSRGTFGVYPVPAPSAALEGGGDKLSGGGLVGATAPPTSGAGGSEGADRARDSSAP